jgi:hypothetical protein
MTYYINGFSKNCYITYSDPIRATMYFKPFTFTLVLWNILFNLGFLYTAGRAITFFFYRDYSEPYTPHWGFLGNNIGDFILRFIFSKFVHSSAYTF